MKVLLTSDWQVSWSNLDKCSNLVAHVLSTCAEQNIQHIVHVGDLKHHYNPIDVRVVNFTVEFIKQVKKAGVESFSLVLGNHDKIGMSESSGDWGPLIEGCGGSVFDSPSHFKIGASTFYAVPYSLDVNYLKKSFRAFANQSNPKKDILLFHNELSQCQLNVHSAGTFKLGAKDLHMFQYKYCFGGHVHMHQKIGKNGWYVGSPFCHDWGEVNQVKYMGMVLDLDTFEITKIRSKEPGYFDPKSPGYFVPKSWKGAHVRIQVPVSLKSDASAALVKAKIKAAAEFEGAHIVTVPKFKDSVAEVALDYQSGDAELLKEYTNQTCPSSLNKEAVAAYLISVVSKFSLYAQASKRVRFLWAKGKNFLCFRKYYCDFQFKGITVVTGHNKDWPNRRNGSGKTSYLQSVSVGLFGSTLKEQANDQWVRRHSKGSAVLKLMLELGDGTKVLVDRRRRPVKLRLLVNGKDKSTGIGVRGTQARIESLTGLTWESLANSVYVAQSQVNTILTGSDAERRKVFSKFLNLQRFDAARDYVAKEYSKVKKMLQSVNEEISMLSSSIASIKETLLEIPAFNVKRTKRRILALLARLKAVEPLPPYPALVQPKASYKKLKRTKLEKRMGELSYRLRDLSARYKKYSTLQGECPTCTQPVRREFVGGLIADVDNERAQVKARLEKIEDSLESIDMAIARSSAAAEAAHTKAVDAYVAAQNKVAALRNEVEREEERIAAYKKALAARTLQKRVIAEAVKKKTVLQKYASFLQSELGFYEYCVAALSKKGLPAHLANQLHPRLNSAADYYSDVFSENEIKVGFVADGPDIDVKIVNVHGGASVKDQSGGEVCIAGLITSFALAEVVSNCRLLILDEPSESLDAHNAKIFAEGLKKVKHRVGAVFLTTHNPYILAELENERLVTVVKTGGVSVIKE